MNILNDIRLQPQTPDSCAKIAAREGNKAGLEEVTVALQGAAAVHNAAADKAVINDIAVYDVTYTNPRQGTLLSLSSMLPMRLWLLYGVVLPVLR